MKNHLLIILGIVISVTSGFCASIGFESSEIGWTVGITVLTAFWWITEPIPIPATSLIPIAAFPLVGVLKPEETAKAFGSWLVLLMLGGFLLSAAMEKSGAHRRIALNMVRMFGSDSGWRLVTGFMFASAALSMWISNAASTLMLLPIAMAVVAQTENRRLQIALLLGVAYGASIGGIGTPIGTPPNMIFMKVYSDTTGSEISFIDWMRIAFPVIALMLPLTAFWLSWGLKDIQPIRLPSVGSWTTQEVRTLIVFAVVAALWITRKGPFGGWSHWLSMPDAKDSSIALLGSVALFLIPSGNSDNPNERLMDWESAKKIPWGILILFAGGISLATAFKQSGLSQEIGTGLSSLGTLPTLLIVLLICTSITFLTEVTSNTATTNLLMPILATASVSAGIEPKVLMIPAALSASFAFMLPVATPPNAIVFGSGKLTVKTMARHGIGLNFLGIAVLMILSFAGLI